MTGKAGILNFEERHTGIIIKDIIIAEAIRKIFAATVNGIMRTGIFITGIIPAGTITDIIIPTITENIRCVITSFSDFRCDDLLWVIQKNS
jgi:hypothetical protein